MNCFFDDCDAYINVRLISALKEDNRGYFINVRITKKDVVTLMENGVEPLYSNEGFFYLPVQINNKTVMRINGIRVHNFSDEKLKHLPIKKVSLRELALKRYSKKTRYTTRQVYASKITIRIKL